MTLEMGAEQDALKKCWTPEVYVSHLMDHVTVRTIDRYTGSATNRALLIAAAPAACESTQRRAAA